MKNKEPELRLLGFNEPWEIRMLKDIFNILDGDRGKNYPGEADFHKEGHTLFLDTGNVRKNGFLFSNKKYISEEKDSSLKNGQLKLNDFVLTSRGTLGNVAFYDELVQSNYPSIRINSAMLILRPKLSDLVSNKYLEAVLRGNLIEKFINKNKVGSAQPHITKGEFSKVNIGIPASIVEQKKIGSFFKDLDDTISLHQQELEALKQTKQGFLQKMFPQEGELVPKIRFSEYKSEWKSIKISDLTTFFTDGDWIEAKDQSEEGIRLIQTGNIGISKFLNKPGKEKWITEETFKKLKCHEVYAGDILISRLPEPAGRACILPNLETRMITAVDCTIIRVDDNNSSEFLLQYLSTSQYFNMVKSYLGGGTRQRISRSVLGDLIIKVPKELTEQIKIGEFFRQLDEVIELKDKEIEALNETKKGFLQKMFV